MTRFYGIDEANAALVELESILSTLASQRAELVRLRDEVIASRGDGGPSATDEPDVPGRSETAVADDLRLARLRMQGLIDQMAAGVARIEEAGVTLRDIPSGLIDFPALVNGRQVWLCWRRGEPEVGYWHPLDTGFADRQPLAELT